jgi:hypothetical protein
MAEWLNVVQKCLENKNVRSIKTGRHDSKCMNRPIMNVEEAAKIYKDHKKWKKILEGGLCPDVGLPRNGNCVKGRPLCQCLSGSAIKISGSRIRNKIRGSGSGSAIKLKDPGSRIRDKNKRIRMRDPGSAIK